MAVSSLSTQLRIPQRAAISADFGNQISDIPVVKVAKSHLQKEKKVVISTGVSLSLRQSAPLPGSALPKIQAMAQSKIGKKKTTLATPNHSELAGLYETDLENLRRHLLNLGNPYLVRLIRETLDAFLLDPLDICDEEAMMLSFKNAGLPEETTGYFQRLFSIVYSTAKSSLSQLNETQKRIKKDLGDLTSQLRLHNNKCLENYQGWDLCEMLFKLPGFSKLKDLDFRKLMKFIDQENPDGLVKYVGELEEMEILDKQRDENYLAGELSYEYDLDTLLSEIIESKPKKKNGIITHWKEPQQFFINKTLRLQSPNGISHAGTIVSCKTKSKNFKTFYLQDKSELIIRKNQFQVRLVKSHAYKLWSAIGNGTFSNNDPLTIEYPSESKNEPSLLAGDYIFSRLKNEKIRSNHFGFELLEASSNMPCYCLEGNCETPFLITIKKWNQKQNRFEILKEEEIQAFESSHRVLKKETREIPDITYSIADQCILITDDPNEERMRLNHLEQIKQELDCILNQLKQKEKVVEKLLDSLVKRQLANVDFNFLEKLDVSLANKIKELSRRYYDDLKIDRSPAEILKQMVLEANYSHLVQKQDNVLMARTIELLRAAYKHTENMRGQELILFMGNTGSGKSTSIGFLMGANLKEFSNHVGENVVKINEVNPATLYPKIGQSIGTSETIYTQGYKLPDTDYMLGDCPGFNDTRGGDYELCTNFSIDQALSQAANVRSIVVVVPAPAFITDKGNNVIDLVDTIKRRFLGTFDPDNIKKSERVFLLITKQNQVPPETMKYLRDGTRFTELIKEAEQQIEELGQRYGRDSIEVQFLKGRQGTWRAIYQLQLNKQVHFIFTSNQKQRKDLIQCYAKKEKYLDKTSYLPAMGTDYMQKKFGDCVQMSTHTWTANIFGRYQNLMRQEQKNKQKVLKQKKSDLENLKATKKKRLELASVIAKDQEELKKYLDHLSKNRNQLSEESLRIELAKALRLIEESISRCTSREHEVQIRLSLKQAELEQTIQELRDVKKQILAKDEQIEFLNRDIDLLKSGEKVEILFQDQLNHGTYSGDLWKSQEDIDDAENTLCIKQSHFHEKEEVFNTANFKGETGGVAIIKRGYRLVPSDPILKNQFFMSGSANGYVAKVEGLRYSIGLGKAEGESTIGYQYTLKWVGDGSIPWIKIAYTIPNSEYNYASIKNLESDIELLKTDLEFLEKKFDGVYGLSHAEIILIKEIRALQSEHSNLRARIEELNELHSKKISDHLKQNHYVLENYEKDQKELKDTTLLDSQIKTITSEIAIQTNTLKNLEKKLRNLAIIITTQWESAKLLREFAGLVVTSCNEKSRKEVITSCQEFINVFDKNKDHLLREIQSKYGFKPS